ncbi:MAG: biotin transporter BioY [Candidatus Omnitrophica bacterium]|nr:biotin transporter BioY [Candidatus Omnitrophota bacterium]
MELSLNSEITTSKTASRAIGVAAFVILTCLGAFVRIPLVISPVPLTLQTFFVLLSGACLGARRGALSQGLYCLLGTLGLPVFTGAGFGLLYLAGPTGGYLAGFVVAGLVLGRFIGTARNLARVFCLMCLADAILLGMGAGWLAIGCGFSIAQAFTAGMLVFVPGDLIKAFAASLVYQKIRNRCSEVF